MYPNKLTSVIMLIARWTWVYVIWRQRGWWIQWHWFCEDTLDINEIRRFSFIHYNNINKLHCFTYKLHNLYVKQCMIEWSDEISNIFNSCSTLVEFAVLLWMQQKIKLTIFSVSSSKIQWNLQQDTPDDRMTIKILMMMFSGLLFYLANVPLMRD